ncbi:MAG: C40 family peptidase [Treponema sp.]|nr:C40 family peptidase [Treponema sp.]
MLRKIILCLIILFSFTSCELIEFFEYIDYIYTTTGSSSSSSPSYEPNNTPKPTVTPDSDSIDYIRSKALEYAKWYCQEDTKYVYGGQDPIPRVLKVDCSGMVINCYKYAVENTKYKLPFNDTTAAKLHSTYSHLTDTPQPGDMIFLGETNSSSVTHIGIFEKKVGSTIYFIDATDGKGVSQRSYDKSNSKIKGYGQIKLVQK